MSQGNEKKAAELGSKVRNVNLREEWNLTDVQGKKNKVRVEIRLKIMTHIMKMCCFLNHYIKTMQRGQESCMQRIYFIFGNVLNCSVTPPSAEFVLWQSTFCLIKEITHIDLLCHLGGFLKLKLVDLTNTSVINIFLGLQIKVMFGMFHLGHSRLTGDHHCLRPGWFYEDAPGRNLCGIWPFPLLWQHLASRCWRKERERLFKWIWHLMYHGYLMILTD